ncbi:MAG: hypothetical protein ACI9IP_003276 [Arcticibacterium sp.]|jgi:hypothetical protein
MFRLLKTFLLFVAVALLSSCETHNPQPSGLNGKWFLEEAQCYCFFEASFEFKAHSLAFDTTTSTVKIVSTDDVFFINKSGSYAYVIKGDELSINNERKYTFELSDRTLKLHYKDDPLIADDELTLVYER